MKSLVNQTHKALLKKQEKIAVAESCTGGLVAKLLTDISGSSKYFMAGIVTYSNKAKEDLLGIPHAIIAKYGAVSEKVATLMAQNVRKIAGADFGLGITGIAGPTGGTKLKPVGTVYIAIAGRNKTTCTLFHFQGNRSTIRKKSALKSLELLKRCI